MLQASVCDGVALDALAPCDDRIGPAEVNVGRGEVVDALMVADVVVMLDEGIDLPFEISGQIIVVEQDAVPEGLVPPFDFPLGLRVIRSAAHMLNAWFCAKWLYAPGRASPTSPRDLARGRQSPSASSRARAEGAASGDTLASMILISSDSRVASPERNLTEPV
jgi:hypothetical protein